MPGYHIFSTKQGLSAEMKDAFYAQLARVPFTIIQCDIIIAWMSFALPTPFAVWEN